MSHTSLRRQAFTLVEILVVIVIIGILLALLFPAIQAARTAAQSAGSANNLRQIGISGLNFESRNGHYPPSWKSATEMGTSTDVSGWSIHALLLPYLEQKVIHSNIDFTRSYSNAPNVMLADGVTSVKLSSLRIPTYVSPGNRRDEVRFSGTTPQHYPVDYGVNLGTFFVWDPATGQGGSGMAYPDSQIKAAQVHDGLSYTVFFAEVKSWQPYLRNSARTTAQLQTALGTSLNPASAHVVDTVTGATTLFTTLHGGALPNVDGSGDFKLDSGHTEWVDGRAHQIGFTAAFTPNTPTMHNFGTATAPILFNMDWNNWQEGKGLNKTTPDLHPTYAIVTARSHFAGGVHVAMADGSVKRVADAVSLPVWRAYCTRDGQELVAPADQL